MWLQAVLFQHFYLLHRYSYTYDRYETVAHETKLFLNQLNTRKRRGSV